MNIGVDVISTLVFQQFVYYKLFLSPYRISYYRIFITRYNSIYHNFEMIHSFFFLRATTIQKRPSANFQNRRYPGCLCQN